MIVTASGCDALPYDVAGVTELRIQRVRARVRRRLVLTSDFVGKSS
jgi:hypothetical protein